MYEIGNIVYCEPNEIIEYANEPVYLEQEDITLKNTKGLYW